MYLSFRVSNGSLILLFSTLLIVDFCQLFTHQISVVTITTKNYGNSNEMLLHNAATGLMV